MIRIFLDTEFTHMNDRRLISIALVADGAEFYAEVDDFQIEGCSDFVRMTVLPLLGRIPGIKMKPDALRTALHAWLDEIRGEEDGIAISFDYQGDWALLVEALGEVPGWIKPQDVRGAIDNATRAEFFNLTGLPEHHALYDAKALMFSYRQPGKG